MRTISSKRVNLVISVAVLILVGRSLQAHAARDWYVSTNGNDGAADSWSSALTDLQTALDLAGSGDTIYLAGHTFYHTNQLVWTDVAGMTIRGGYAATNDVVLPGANNPALWPTILTHDSENQHRILRIADVNDGALEQVTVTGGHAMAPDSGGGIQIEGSTDIILSDCIVTNNVTQGNANGGGMHVLSSVVTLTNSVVAGNTLNATGTGYNYGGGIYSQSSTLTLYDTIIAFNGINGALRRPGGGIGQNGGTVTLWNCLIVANSTASWRGDGLYIHNGSLNLRNCTVADNSGQGIYRYGGTVSVINSILWGNVNDVLGDGVSLAWSLSGNGVTHGIDGNRSVDPMFERGYYLATNSPGVNAGTNTAAYWGLSGYTTRTDGEADSGTVNLGYHYTAGYDFSYGDFFVSTNGVDSNSGTSWGQSFRSITKAFTVARDGTRIHVGAGYYGNDLETFPLLLNHRIGLEIRGRDSLDTVIDATGSERRVLILDRCSRLNFSDLTFAGGYLPQGGNGGGLAILNSGGVTFLKCIVSGNETVGNWNGGGIYSFSSVVFMDDCRIVDNTLSASGTGYNYGGGISVMGGGGLTVWNSVIAGNQLPTALRRCGGGIGLHRGTVKLKNCLVTGNSSALNRGDGLYIGGGRMHLESCTVVDNNAGRGIWREGGTLTMTNTIVWGHDLDLHGYETNSLGHIVGIGYSLFAVPDMMDGVDGCLVADPRFIDPAEGDYRLSNTHGIGDPEKHSPAIDAGLNQSWMGVAVDLQGHPRIMPGCVMRNYIVDMGAYEASPPRGTLYLLR